MFEEKESGYSTSEGSIRDGEELNELYSSQVHHIDKPENADTHSHLSRLYDTNHHHNAHGHHAHSHNSHNHDEHMSLLGDQGHASSKEGQFDAVFTILIIAILCSALIFVGYYMPGIPIGTGSSQVMTRAVFIDTIRFNGGYTTYAGPLNISLLSVPGYVHTIDSDQIIIFEYDSGSELTRDAARISANGSTIDKKQYAWQGAPHFYKSGRVLVLYLGSNQRTLALLSYVLGQPFIGAPITFNAACSITNRCPGTEVCVAFIGDTLCLNKDPCTLCGDGGSCKKFGSYPVEVVCS